MLVLTRHRDESIVIDGHIRVMVVEIRGDKVRIGVEAPDEITVNREEVEERIRLEREGRRRP
jgi:carbon storage regulator